MCTGNKFGAFTLEAIQDENSNARTLLNSTTPTFNFPRSVLEDRIYFALTSGTTISSLEEYFSFNMLLEDGESGQKVLPGYAIFFFP